MNSRRAHAGRALLAILISALCLTLAVGCSDDNPTAPQMPPGPQRVLVLDDNGTQDSVVTILDAAGFDVTRGGHFWEYTGTDLASYEMVVLLDGAESNHDIPDSVQQKLVNFVSQGGGLLTTEWITWYHWSANHYFSTLMTILPVTYDDADEFFYGSDTYVKVLPGHAIASGLPDSFAVSGYWTQAKVVLDSAQAKQATSVFRTTRYENAVVAGVHGAGKVVHWAMAGESGGKDIWSPEVERLLRNIVGYAAKPR